MDAYVIEDGKGLILEVDQFDFDKYTEYVDKPGYTVVLAGNRQEALNKYDGPPIRNRLLVSPMDKQIVKNMIEIIKTGWTPGPILARDVYGNAVLDNNELAVSWSLNGALNYGQRGIMRGGSTVYNFIKRQTGSQPPSDWEDGKTQQDVLNLLEKVLEDIDEELRNY